MACWPSSSALVTGLVVLVLGGLLVAVSPNTVTFIAAVAVYGIGVGMVDAAVNMQAAAVQRRVGTVILSSFFASWSGGAILGAVAVSLGVAMALFYAVDFGLSNWSPIFLHDALLATPSTAALGVAAYQVAGFFSRMTADFWTRKFGAVRVVLTGGFIATGGMLLTITSQSIPVALAGLGITGLGASVIAPLCFSAAAQLSSERSLDVIIARLNLFNYAGTIVGGVVIGSVLALTDPRIALVIPLAACIGLMTLARRFGAGVEKQNSPQIGPNTDNLNPTAPAKQA